MSREQREFKCLNYSNLLSELEENIFFLTALQKVSKYRVFSGPYSVRMRENTDQKKLCNWTLFTQWSCLKAEDFKKIVLFGFSKYTVIRELVCL